MTAIMQPFRRARITIATDIHHELVLGDMTLTVSPIRVAIHGTPVDEPFDTDVQRDPAALLARAVLRGERDAIWPMIDELLARRDRLAYLPTYGDLHQRLAELVTAYRDRADCAALLGRAEGLFPRCEYDRCRKLLPLGHTAVYCSTECANADA